MRLNLFLRIIDLPLKPVSSVWERPIASVSATKAGSTWRSPCAASQRIAACPGTASTPSTARAKCWSVSIASRSAIEHAGLGKATLTVTQIKSAPEISHTVPDTCRITLDRRLLPGDDPDVALGSIRDAVADLSPWSVEVTRGAFMYPSEVDADCAVAAAVRRAGRALNGQDGEVFYLPAALDAGYLNQRGIETIMFGPGDLHFAHTDEEVVSMQEVRDAARIYAATALELLT